MNFIRLITSLVKSLFSSRLISFTLMWSQLCYSLRKLFIHLKSQWFLFFLVNFLDLHRNFRSRWDELREAFHGDNFVDAFTIGSNVRVFLWFSCI
eukprot:snap_masked-scaffold_1-processed-gene-27.31-mRNA-1 protein AED:1.00 eAED:1.00 QI:0/0/0/0/1/1/2/0/94